MTPVSSAAGLASESVNVRNPPIPVYFQDVSGKSKWYSFESENGTIFLSGCIRKCPEKPLKSNTFHGFGVHRHPAVLRSVEKRGHYETARRLRSTCGQAG